MKKIKSLFVLAVMAALFIACQKEVILEKVKKDYEFNLTTWYLPSEISQIELVKIRFYLEREGVFDDAEYEFGFTQLKGKGAFFDESLHILKTQDIIPLSKISTFDDSNPARLEFTIFYSNTSEISPEIRFFVRDNFGQESEIKVNFTVVQSS